VDKPKKGKRLLGQRREGKRQLGLMRQEKGGGQGERRRRVRVLRESRRSSATKQDASKAGVPSGVKLKILGKASFGPHIYKNRSEEVLAQIHW